MAVLLHSTNCLLNDVAQATNQFVKLGEQPKIKRQKKPQYLVRAEKSLFRTHRLIRYSSPLDPHYARLKLNHQVRKHNLLCLIRYRRYQEYFKRDSLLNTIRTGNPRSIYHTLKKIRAVKTERIHKLTVDQDTYEGHMVPDGIFESLRRLKSEPVLWDTQ